DPCTNEKEAPIFYGRTLVEKILNCPVRQEIASHSFSHAVFGDPGCSRETADSELRASIDAARSLGIEMRSFVFPRNDVGHLERLREHGFTCYRGPQSRWYESRKVPAMIRRCAHLWDVLTASEPPVVLPLFDDSGLWNVPASMVYFPIHGFRRLIPMSVRVRRAVKGLEAASRERRIFHLWFHPTNLAEDCDVMVHGLRVILEQAAAKRVRGELDFLPMASLVPSRRGFSPARLGRRECPS
ncbi:MAG: hypothetical protein ACRD2A_10515, partial [Vicinamibacterales bacterium]